MANNKPTITYTEILCRAIQSFEAEISELREKANGNPKAEEVIGEYVGNLAVKIDAIKTLYKIETGTQFV